MLKSQFVTSPNKSSRKVPKQGLGPGQYDADRGTSVTKSRSKSALISQTSRPDINKRTQAGTGDLGPGAYDDGNTFGKKVVGYSFGKPKPEKVEVDNRDYGYDPDREFKQTRHRSPSATIRKDQPGRPSSFANAALADQAGPGHYDDGKRFNDGVKSYSFGKPKPERLEVDNRDYGYDPDREFSATRHRSPAAIISKTQRPASFANQA